MNRFYGTIEELGDREIGVVASTDQLGRDRMVVYPQGIDLTHYRKNPIVLWQHLADCPIGTSTAVGVQSAQLAARIEFAPLGASPLADQICSLAKAGVVRGVSIGFDPQQTEPLDPKNPRAGVRVIRSELMEISIVSIPADYGAGVVARSLGTAGFRMLPTIPVASVHRASARFSKNVARPAVYSPTMHAWMLCEQRRREHDAIFSFEARQAELRRLSPR